MLIAFLGDSLTEGWPGAAYFPLLDRRMSQHGLLNRGRAGDTVADLLSRMRYQGLEPVDCAFIWVGANDAVMGAWDASEAGSGWSWPERLMRLAGDYEELLEWTEARAPRIVVVRPLVLESEGSLWEERAAEVAEAIARIAAGRSSCRVRRPAPGVRGRRRGGRRPLHHRRRALHGGRRRGGGRRLRRRHRRARGRGREPGATDAAPARRRPEDLMKRLHKIALAAVALEALGAAYSFVAPAAPAALGRDAATRCRAPCPATTWSPTRCTRRPTPSPCAPPPTTSGRGWSRSARTAAASTPTTRSRTSPGLKVRSADRVHPEWQDLRAGEDYLTLDPDETMKMTVAVLEPPHAFVVRSGAPGEPPQEAGSLFRGEMAWTWGFYLEPAGAAETRLIIRSRASWRRTVPAAFAQAFGLEPAHFIMEEGMLRGIRGRAERAASGG